jgi:hypothetical protein
MLLWLVLGLILVGAVLGGSGMRRLGRWTSRAAGRWRPGVGMGAILFAFAGLILSVRGGLVVGLPLLALSGVLAVTARRRGGQPAAQSPTAPKISEADARAMLGVSQKATRKEIQEAYVRLMQRAHPDQGGTTGLAAQLNAARDRLLR